MLIPYLVLIAAAMFLQYYQMRQMNSRNPQAAAANPQMQTMQKFFPIIFGVIYLRVPAGATIYMVVSSAMRIGTQEVMFRTGMVAAVAPEREIGSAKKEEKPNEKATSRRRRSKKKSTATDGTAVAKGTVPPAKSGTEQRASQPTEGSRPQGRHDQRQGGERRTTRRAPKAHPRSRSKRARKAR